MSKGFKLCIAFLILAITVILLYPVVPSSNPTGDCNRAVNEIRAVEAAIHQYYNEYNRFPNTGPGGEIANREIIPTLLGEATPQQNQNPRRRKFLALPSEVSKHGELLDPWGTPYHIMVDSDYDSAITINGRRLEKLFIVWSSGENKINEFGLGDDVSTFAKKE